MKFKAELQQPKFPAYYGRVAEQQLEKLFAAPGSIGRKTAGNICVNLPVAADGAKTINYFLYCRQRLGAVYAKLL